MVIDKSPLYSYRITACGHSFIVAAERVTYRGPDGAQFDAVAYSLCDHQDGNRPLAVVNSPKAAIEAAELWMQGA